MEEPEPWLSPERTASAAMVHGLLADGTSQAFFAKVTVSVICAFPSAGLCHTFDFGLAECVKAVDQCDADVDLGGLDRVRRCARQTT